MDILAERVAAATAEKLAPLIASEVSRVLTAERPEDLSEHLEGSAEVMNAGEAADFVRMGKDGFNKIAPGLPRHHLSERRYIYLREDLLEWLRSR